MQWSYTETSISAVQFWGLWVITTILHKTVSIPRYMVNGCGSQCRRERKTQTGRSSKRNENKFILVVLENNRNRWSKEVVDKAWWPHNDGHWLLPTNDDRSVANALVIYCKYWTEGCNSFLPNRKLVCSNEPKDYNWKVGSLNRTAPLLRPITSRGVFTAVG